MTQTLLTNLFENWQPSKAFGAWNYASPDFRKIVDPYIQNYNLDTHGRMRIRNAIGDFSERSIYDSILRNLSGLR